MEFTGNFNPEKDLFEVVGGLSIDLAEAISSGLVGDTGVDLDYNDLDSPDKIGNRVDNIFDAIEARNEIYNREKARQTVTSPDAKKSESNE